MVRELAQELAHDLYDITMTKFPEAYSEWRRRHPGANAKQLEDAFVAKYYGSMVQSARATLAGMLSLPYDDAFKQRIHEALILDGSLKLGRGRELNA
jgi:hypothetical protein